MTTKEGTKYFFGNGGQLLAVKDRYGNEIRFNHDYKYRITEITDTVGRKLTFSYSSTEVVVTAKDKDGTPMGIAIKYKLSNITTDDDNDGYGNNKKQLDRVIRHDENGTEYETRYDYALLAAEFGYDYWDNWNYNIATNYYLALTEIVPMGNIENKGSTVFSWEQPMPRRTG